jgi:Nif-specific regulatory protein
MEAAPTESLEQRELRLLFEAGQILDRGSEPHEILEPILQLVAGHTGMLRATLALVDRSSGEVLIEAAYGLSDRQKERGRYRSGEGVTGVVVQTGLPAVIPRVSEEPRFLNRTGSVGDGEISFICVPIRIGDEVVGTLGGVRPPCEADLLQKDARLLATVASMISQTVRQRQSVQENQRLHQQLQDRFRPGNIIGTARSMQAVYAQILQVSRSNTNVLIRGESGTGKELVANAIHYNSLRADGPFVRVNCAALPEPLVESELFGHEKGAFTGALALRKGRFELASGGTIFLDEVGDFSPATQVKLLRVLQEREFERVGGSAPIRTDVRILAATNRDLESMMKEGRFRQDLYYRLNVFSIHLPPLRERKTDILLLADHFAQKYSKSNGKTIRRFSTPAIDMLMSYHWPGNVRELENCIERAALLTEDEVIHGHHLPPTLQTAEATGTVQVGTLQGSLERAEMEMIVEALKVSRGNKAEAARALGITERLMGLRVLKYGIDPRRFRTRA